MQNDNIVERLLGHAAAQPDTPALRFLAGDAVASELTYAQLDARIWSVAARLQKLAGPGERALVLLPSGVNYVVAYYACLYAGIIAVPAYPPGRSAQRYADRLSGILHDAAPRLILIDGESRTAVTGHLADVGSVHVLHMDEH